MNLSILSDTRYQRLKKMQSQGMTVTRKYVSIPESLEIHQPWDVAFPLDEKTSFSRYMTEPNRYIGAVVRRYTSFEARFVLRGDLNSKEDLAFCLSVAEKKARQFGCRVLSTQERVNPEWLDALNTFQDQGFKIIDESWLFTGPFNSFASRIRRIESLLDQKKAIPQEARVSSLKEGIQFARAILNDSLMMDDFEFDNSIKFGALKPISTTYSQIAWYGNKIVGVLLVATTLDERLFDIPIRYVLPEFRQKWVNALLISACVRHGEKIGAEFIQFEANSKSHTETFALAKKTGCTRVAIFNRFQKILSV